MKKRFLSALLLSVHLLLPRFNAAAQPHALSRLDSFFAAQAARQQLFGNVLITQDNTVIYKTCSGFRDIDNNVPNSDSSAFAVASISKVITATAILQLKEKGLLKLDDKLTDYFADFPFAGITIRHLLTHTSGLPSYELFDSIASARPDKVFVNEDIPDALKRWSKPLAKPGEDWYYSGMNYCLLALIIEKISKLNLQDYFKKYIFEPAGMDHSSLENYFITADDKNKVINYEPAFTHSTKLFDVNNIPTYKRMLYNYGGFLGQGGLVTTVGDMAKFDRAWFSGKLIGPASIEESLTSVKLKNGVAAAATNTFDGKGMGSCGLGWSICAHPLLGKLVWYEGIRPGIKTLYLHATATNQTVIILGNTGNNANLIAMAVYSLKLINGHLQ
jgi:CubicO group peptidase (beta-lactamase class C family)